MVSPEKPAFFDLNALECRLLAPRIAFQKLTQAPRGKQFKIHGNIVNVPADVPNTVTMLPWLPSETATIKVKLQFKSSAMSLNIRPHKVIKAGRWFMTKSEPYRDEGIALHQLHITKKFCDMTTISVMTVHVISHQYQMKKAIMILLQKYHGR